MKEGPTAAAISMERGAGRGKCRTSVFMRIYPYSGGGSEGSEGTYPTLQFVLYTYLGVLFFEIRSDSTFTKFTPSLRHAEIACQVVKRPIFSMNSGEGVKVVNVHICDRRVFLPSRAFLLLFAVKVENATFTQPSLRSREVHQKDRFCISGDPDLEIFLRLFKQKGARHRWGEVKKYKVTPPDSARDLHYLHRRFFARRFSQMELGA